MYTLSDYLNYYDTKESQIKERMEHIYAAR